MTNILNCINEIFLGKNGWGKITLADNSIEEGLFRNGVLYYGKRITKTGSIYKGNFRFNKLHGKGLVILNEGGILDGTFRYGVFLKGSVINSDNVIIIGIRKNKEYDLIPEKY